MMIFVGWGGGGGGGAFVSGCCDMVWRWCCDLALLVVQSQKTQGFFVADFATLSDERRSRSKIFPLSIWIKEPCVRKSEGLKRSKLLGISQTMLRVGCAFW